MKQNVDDGQLFSSTVHATVWYMSRQSLRESAWRPTSSTKRGPGIHMCVPVCAGVCIANLSLRSHTLPHCPVNTTSVHLARCSHQVETLQYRSASDFAYIELNFFY